MTTMDPMRHATETMRNDPARRAAVAQQMVDRQAVFAKAQALVAEAKTLLLSLGDTTDDALLDRCIHKVVLTDLALSSDAGLIMGEPGETLIGNRAAFGSPLGWTPNQ